MGIGNFMAFQKKFLYLRLFDFLVLKNGRRTNKNSKQNSGFLICYPRANGRGLTESMMVSEPGRVMAWAWNIFVVVKLCMNQSISSAIQMEQWKPVKMYSIDGGATCVILINKVFL